MSPRSALKKLSVTDSEISISDLLEYVNLFYPEVLPLDVLKCFHRAQRPNSERRMPVEVKGKNSAAVKYFWSENGALTLMGNKFFE